MVFEFLVLLFFVFRAHEQANAERKLSPGERKAKKIKKLTEDTDLGVHVAIYRLRDLSDPAKKFKVDTNAQQYFMTGWLVYRLLKIHFIWAKNVI